MIIRKPESLSWIEAAGIPENWMTAFQALFLEGGFKQGENVLVHAVSQKLTARLIEADTWLSRAPLVWE